MLLPDGTLVECLQNAAGQRMAKKVNGVVAEKYLWAGITGLLAVYDGSDNPIIRFEGAKMVKNSQAYYLITDQVGTVRAVADATGNIVKEITYDSFGNILNDTNPSFTIPLGFAGGLHDRDTGLARFGYRDYDPDNGRWTAKDPIGVNRFTWSTYTYCSGNPICLSDPSGLYEWGAFARGFANGAVQGLAVVTDTIDPFGDYWAERSVYSQDDPGIANSQIAARIGVEALEGATMGGATRLIGSVARTSKYFGTASPLLGTGYRVVDGALKRSAAWRGILNRTSTLRLGWYCGLDKKMYMGLHGNWPWHWHASGSQITAGMTSLIGKIFIY